MAGKKENKPTGLGGPRGLLSLIYLPHFMKIHGLSDEDVAKARAGSVYQEIFRSVLISCLVTVVMMVYLIYGLLSGYFLSGSRDKAFLLTAILLMLGSGVTYLIYYLLTYKRSLGVIRREAIQFVYYLCIVASILLFHVATKTNPATAADFSLGYIWFLALAITPPTYIAYWLAISGLSLAGCIATISTLETVQTNATQCYIIVVSFIIVSYFIRSHDFISSYYKNRVQEENEENGHLAQTDQLTGIENRRALDEFVSTRSKGWEEKGSKVCILMFDIDFFKCYNDVLGHIQGDKCLNEVTAAVKEAAFDSSLHLYRFGGDEFVGVIEDPIQEDVVKTALSLLRAIQEAKIKAPTETGATYLTISIGISSAIVGHNYSFTRHISEADQYLYEAKKNHRGSAVYDGKIYSL